MQIIPAILSTIGTTASTAATVATTAASTAGTALQATWGALSGAAGALTGMGGTTATGTVVGTASANAASLAGIEGLAGAAGYSQAAAGASAAASGLSLGEGLGYASAGLSGLSAYQQAKASNTAAEYNAQQAEEEADQTTRQGRLQEQKIRNETAQEIGEQRAAAAASGVDPNVGSPVSQQATTKQYGEYDALTTRFNAQRQAEALREQADAYRSSTVSPLMAGITSGLSTGLTVLSNRNLKKLYTY